MAKKIREDKGIREYLAHLKRRNCSERTLSEYGYCLGVLRKWLLDAGVNDFHHVQSKDLEQFQVWLANEQRLAPSTLEKYVAVVKEFFGFLHSENKMLVNIGKSLRYPKVIRKRIHQDVLNKDELLRFLHPPNECTPESMRDYLAVRMLFVTGARASEILGLDLQDVNVKEKELVIRHGKGSKERIAFCDPETQRTLATYLVQSRHHLAAPREPALLVNNDGGRLSIWSLREVVRRKAKTARIGKHVRCHSLRRTFCTLMMTIGQLDIRTISLLLGHERISTTARYQHLDVKQLVSIYRESHPRCL